MYFNKTNANVSIHKNQSSISNLATITNQRDKSNSRLFVRRYQKFMHPREKRARSKSPERGKTCLLPIESTPTSSSTTSSTTSSTPPSSTTSTTSASTTAAALSSSTSASSLHTECKPYVRFTIKYQSWISGSYYPQLIWFNLYCSPTTFHEFAPTLEEWNRERKTNPDSTKALINLTIDRREINGDNHFNANPTAFEEVKNLCEQKDVIFGTQEDVYNQYWKASPCGHEIEVFHAVIKANKTQKIVQFLFNKFGFCEE